MALALIGCSAANAGGVETTVSGAAVNGKPLSAQMDQQSIKLTGDWQEGIRLGMSVRDLAESLARLNPYNDDPDMEEENTRFGLAVQAVRRAGEISLR